MLNSGGSTLLRGLDINLLVSVLVPAETTFRLLVVDHVLKFNNLAIIDNSVRRSVQDQNTISRSEKNTDKLFF